MDSTNVGEKTNVSLVRRILWESRNKLNISTDAQNTNILFFKSADLTFPLDWFILKWRKYKLYKVGNYFSTSRVHIPEDLNLGQGGCNILKFIIGYSKLK